MTILSLSAILALDTVSSNGVDYASREAGAGRPTVIVTVAP